MEFMVSNHHYYHTIVRVFSDMFLEKIDKKRIKLSAFGPDSTAVQIFLITIGFSVCYNNNNNNNNKFSSHSNEFIFRRPTHAQIRKDSTTSSVKSSRSPRESPAENARLVVILTKKKQNIYGDGKNLK